MLQMRDGGAASWPRSGQPRGPGPGQIKTNLFHLRPSATSADDSQSNVRRSAAPFFSRMDFAIESPLCARAGGPVREQLAMEVIVADSLGMCFGVRDAVAMALNAPYRSDL